MSENANSSELPRFAQLMETWQLRNGENVTVRLPRESDAAAYCSFLPRCHVESDFLMYFPGEFDKTEEDERAYIRDALREEGRFLILAEHGGRIVASAGAQGQPYRRYAHQAEIGLVVARAWWGLGLGRRLMETLIDWGRWRELHKMILRVFADNHSAVALYEDLGFREEGRLVDDVLRQDGSWCDTVVMALFLNQG